MVDRGDFAKKATLAMFTGGMSLVGEAAIKGIKNSTSEWIPYELLMDYKYVVNNQRVTSREGSSVRIAKGIHVGGGTKVSRDVTSSSYFELTINDLNLPYVKIPIINKPLSGKAFEQAVKYEKETEAALKYIMNR